MRAGLMLTSPRARGWVPKHVGCWVLRNRNWLTNYYYLIFVQIRVPFFVGIFRY